MNEYLVKKEKKFLTVLCCNASAICCTPSVLIWFQARLSTVSVYNETYNGKYVVETKKIFLPCYLLMLERGNMLLRY
jgi:hypothetical protein